MARGSGIEWTESTWNPVTGCTKVSPGCKHCYAERMAERLQAMGQANYAHGFRLTLQPHMLELPLQWKKPQTIFVNSMSDLFHEGVPYEYIQQVFDVMARAHWHRFQVLTKRGERLAELGPSLPWPPNVWMGVSVETEKYRWRIDALRATDAQIKFLSLEPLLGPLHDLDLDRIDWVIIGGESGPKARAVDPEWVTDLRDQCRRAGVPFFFKQWGGRNKKQAGRLLQGRTWNQMPQAVSARAPQELPRSRTMRDNTTPRPVRRRQPTHPGEILREDVLPALRLSVSEAARQLRVTRQTLHRILSGRSAVTPEMAVRLGKFCGNGPDLWLRMQQAHDLWRAQEQLRTELEKIPAHAVR